MTRYTRLAFEARVRVEGEGEVRVEAYSGRAVKGLAASCSEAVKRVVDDRTPRTVKPFASTPLYRPRPDGRIEALYPGGPSPSEIRVPVLRDGDAVYFEFGLGGVLVEEAERLIECLESSWHPLLGIGETPAIVEDVGLVGRAEWDSDRDPPLLELSNASLVKLVLAAPTIPTNPWRLRSRYKPLIPDPAYLFAVNALDLEPGAHLALVETVASTLSPAYSILETVKLRWYRYEPRKNPAPALIGYANLYVDPDATEMQLEATARVLTHATLMGIGTSRATGLGVAKIDTYPAPRIRFIDATIA